MNLLKKIFPDFRHCWKCGKISRFEKTTVEYVAKRKNGYQCTCKRCMRKWKKENNIKSITRIDKKETGKMFNNFIFELWY